MYLQIRKHEFKLDYINAYVIGDQRKCLSNQALIEAQIKVEVVDLRYNKVNKNALLVTRYGLAYLIL